VNPVTIQSVGTYLLTNLVSRGVAAAGAILVTHGVTTDAQVAQQIGPLTQEIVGGLLLLVSAADAWYRAHAKRNKEITLDTTPVGAAVIK
jgi:hypothetical protein